MKEIKMLPAIVFVAAVAMWGIWQLVARTAPLEARGDQRIIEREHGESGRDPKQEDRDQADLQSSMRRRPAIDRSHPDGTVWPIGKAVSELKGICEKKEASRTRLMNKQHVDAATVYYLDVVPPSREEVRELKATIAEVERRVDKADEQKMDEWITWMIDRYDPFGSEGRKIIGIRIPCDPVKRISGWILPTSNPAATLEEMLGGGYTAPDNMQFYVSSYDDKSERFDEFLVYDAETESSGAKSYKLRTEHDGTGHTATRPATKPESGDKPQAEAEGRSR